MSVFNVSEGMEKWKFTEKMGDEKKRRGNR